MNLGHLCLLCFKNLTAICLSLKDYPGNPPNAFAKHFFVEFFALLKSGLDAVGTPALLGITFGHSS